MEPLIGKYSLTLLVTIFIWDFFLIRWCFRNTCKQLQVQCSVNLLYLMLLNFRPAQPRENLLFPRNSQLPCLVQRPHRFSPEHFVFFSSWAQSGLTDKNKRERAASQELWRGRALGRVRWPSLLFVLCLQSVLEEHTGVETKSQQLQS